MDAKKTKFTLIRYAFRYCVRKIRFTAAGIKKASLGAKIMSKTAKASGGGVKSNSFVAFCQSFGTRIFHIFC